MKKVGVPPALLTVTRTRHVVSGGGYLLLAQEVNTPNNLLAAR